MSESNFYEKILNEMLEDMHNFGLISSIALSSDVYESMSTKEINHLESLMSGGIKWIISNEKEGYYHFFYNREPMEYYDDI